VELEGEIGLTRFPMLELLIQNRHVGEEAEQTCEDIQSSLRSLMNLFDIAWDFSPEVEKKWRNTLGKLSILIEEHPEMQTEIEEIVKKYSLFPA
jgi:septation ring formation regulator EzrA